MTQQLCFNAWIRSKCNYCHKPVLVLFHDATGILKNGNFHTESPNNSESGILDSEALVWFQVCPYIIVALEQVLLVVHWFPQSSFRSPLITCACVRARVCHVYSLAPFNKNMHNAGKDYKDWTCLPVWYNYSVFQVKYCNIKRLISRHLCTIQLQEMHGRYNHTLPNS